MKVTDDNMKEAMKKKLMINQNKGFHITFKNGWTVSVQFGWGSYCENYNNDIKEIRDYGKFPYASDDAEVWVFNRKTDQKYPKDPLSYQSPEQILAFVNKISRRKK